MPGGLLGLGELQAELARPGSWWVTGCVAQCEPVMLPMGSSREKLTAPVRAGCHGDKEPLHCRRRVAKATRGTPFIAKGWGSP